MHCVTNRGMRPRLNSRSDIHARKERKEECNTYPARHILRYLTYMYVLYQYQILQQYQRGVGL